jgi:hypothetical protein
MDAAAPEISPKMTPHTSKEILSELASRGAIVTDPSAPDAEVSEGRDGRKLKTGPNPVDTSSIAKQATKENISQPT